VHAEAAADVGGEAAAGVPYLAGDPARRWKLPPSSRRRNRGDDE